MEVTPTPRSMSSSRTAATSLTTRYRPLDRTGRCVGESDAELYRGARPRRSELDDAKVLRREVVDVECETAVCRGRSPGTCPDPRRAGSTTSSVAFIDALPAGFWRTSSASRPRSIPCGDDCLSGFEMKALIVEPDIDLVGLERHQIADPARLRPRVDIRPRRLLVLSDGVVVGQTLVGAECLALNGFELRSRRCRFGRRTSAGRSPTRTRRPADAYRR